MARYAWRFWWAALAAAWAVDFLFWDKSPGVSFPLWVLLVLLIGIGLAVGERKRPAWPTLLLMVLALFTSVLTFVRAEPLTRLVNAGLSLSVLLLLAATFRNGHWIVYRVLDYLKAGMQLIGAMFSRPVALLQTGLKSEDGEEGVPTWKMGLRKMLPVLGGLLLALPVIVVLAALLSSADKIFADWLADCLSFFDLSRIGEYIFRLFYIVFILSYLFSGVYLHAVLPDKQETRPDNRNSIIKPFLGWVQGSIVLLSVDLLFAVFVVIQFRYFFGGQANIHATGYTYSEYARRGFGELVAVALISLALYLALHTVTRREAKYQSVTFAVLNIALMAFVIVILVSAFERLTLYEGAYGFTRLRMYTHIFILWLGALLFSVIVLELFTWQHWFVLISFAAICGFVISLGVFNVDGMIASENIKRTYSGAELDGDYLSSLSVDAVPVMVRTFSSSESLPGDVYIVLGRQLACRTAEMKMEPLQPWQSFHLAREIAWGQLYRNQDLWNNDFAVTLKPDGDWTVTVKKIEVPCTPVDTYND